MTPSGSHLCDSTHPKSLKPSRTKKASHSQR